MSIIFGFDGTGWRNLRRPAGWVVRLPYRVYLSFNLVDRLMDWELPTMTISSASLPPAALRRHFVCRVLRLLMVNIAFL